MLGEGWERLGGTGKGEGLLVGMEGAWEPGSTTDSGHWGSGGEHREQRGLPKMGPDTEGLRHSSDAITCGMMRDDPCSHTGTHALSCTLGCEALSHGAPKLAAFPWEGKKKIKKKKRRKTK